jgi:hypothetical protein
MGIEEDTQTIAHAVLHLRGPRSHAYADQRIREAEALGDRERAAKWRRVRQLMRELIGKSEAGEGFKQRND